ncbi:hypothetical protein OQA88_8909 [Cercophora sp. LCS_1]
MKLLTLISALTTSSAFIFPSDQPDGIYTVSISASGNALSSPVLIANFSSLPGLSRRQAPNLPNPSTNCHNRGINRGDYDTALRAFNTICDRVNTTLPSQASSSAPAMPSHICATTKTRTGAGAVSRMKQMG